MLLTSIPLQNYQNINSFNSTETQWTVRNGDSNTLYFRIVDQDQGDLRYIPLGVNPSMTVTFTGNYDFDPQVPQSFTPAPTIKIATPVDSARDLSLWQITINTTDTIYSGNVFFSLNNGGVIRNWVGTYMISVQGIGPSVGGC